MTRPFLEPFWSPGGPLEVHFGSFCGLFSRPIFGHFLESLFGCFGVGQMSKNIQIPEEFQLFLKSDFSPKLIKRITFEDPFGSILEPRGHPKTTSENGRSRTGTKTVKRGYDPSRASIKELVWEAAGPPNC